MIGQTNKQIPTQTDKLYILYILYIYRYIKFMLSSETFLPFNFTLSYVACRFNVSLILFNIKLNNYV